MRPRQGCHCVLWPAAALADHPCPCCGFHVSGSSRQPLRGSRPGQAPRTGSPAQPLRPPLLHRAGLVSCRGAASEGSRGCAGPFDRGCSRWETNGLSETIFLVRDSPTVQLVPAAWQTAAERSGAGGCRRRPVSLRQPCRSRRFKSGLLVRCLLGSDQMSLLGGWDSRPCALRVQGAEPPPLSGTQHESAGPAPVQGAMDSHGGQQPSLVTAESQVTTPGTLSLMDAQSFLAGPGSASARGPASGALWEGPVGVPRVRRAGCPAAPSRPPGAHLLSRSTSDPNRACHEVLAGAAGRKERLIVLLLSLPKMLNF